MKYFLYHNLKKKQTVIAFYPNEEFAGVELYKVEEN